MSDENTNKNLTVVKAPESFVEKMLMNTETIDAAKELGLFIINSGFAPKHFSIDKPSAVIIAIDMGQSLGLKWSQALQEIVVIEGTPAVKGDGAKALIVSSPICESWEEEITGTFPNDDYTVTIKTKRKGQKEHITSFSIADAKRAGLWITEANVQSNWKLKFAAWYKYPKRMVRYRALGFIARDVYPDILKGMRTLEEVQDNPEPIHQVVDTNAGEMKIQNASNEIVGKTEGKVAETGKGAAAPGPKVQPPSYQDLKVRTVIGVYNFDNTKEIEVGFVGMCTEDDGIMVVINNGEIMCPRSAVVAAEEDEALTASAAEVVPPGAPGISEPAAFTNAGKIRTDYNQEELEAMGSNATIRNIAAQYCQYDKIDDKSITNRKLRNIILHAQQGKLKAFFKQYYPGKENLIRSTYKELGEETAPAENGAAAATQPARVFNIADVAERDSDQMKEALDYITDKTGGKLTNDNLGPVLDSLGIGYFDVYTTIEQVTKYATLSEIDTIIGKFTNS